MHLNLIRFAFALLAGLLPLTPALADTVRFAWLALDKDVRYDDKRTFFRTLSQPPGNPYAGAEVAMRESRFVGQALKIDFKLDRATGADTSALLAQLDRLHAEGVRYFLVDAPAAVQAELGRATRGKELLLFNVSAADDALRQAQCQPHVFHTLPNHAMQADAIAQFLVSNKWRSILLLEGPLAEDKLIATAFERAAKRFGLKITDKRSFVLSNDPRQRNQGNVGLLTAGSDYDAIFVADSDGEFARGVPYRSVRPRPVVGSEGLVAEAWHWAWERHGAPQLTSRMIKQADRHPGSADWAAWMAVKAVVEAVVRTENAPFPKLVAYLAGEDITLDGFKGNRLGFRPWDRQLRQPLLIATHNAVIERAPIDGFLHQHNNMDTLGFDQRDSQCKF
ncbi:ABC transporter substrate-binding protein [Parazoarcus communis]|uniref:Amino acid ABC transporter substrate-binding protein n=1 Tax=Parazoarcus communis SWub3 = DSM 12120 TaxID=1121029 RepID=A0A323VA10_9RHOO|nr:ABC transporter substrate-binding protein [Parazoarcus communis]NMG70497.1 ABC transporter substrate-binding protein [Parazoarcus communis SWub3 = DSM 12120]PZA17088.1 amino acid ABC transporter substrate-binding protein [Azoarcus communis] [Parazoarcus communis SWub3 = DSM 12120]